MQHKLSVTTQQLVVIREALHAITIKGTDAWIVGTVLDKVYSEIAKADKKKEGVSPPDVSGATEFPEGQVVAEANS
jgi:hypothetical protein